MRRPPVTRTSSLRETLASTESREVRVAYNILTNKGFLYSLFDCVTFRIQESRGFAQSTLINVVIHGVIGGP